MPSLNSYLASLTPEANAFLMAGAKDHSLPRDTVLYEAESVATHAYFLTSGVASLVITTAAGSKVEVGMIGCEGMASPSMLQGSIPEVVSCVLQTDSHLYAVPRHRMEQATERFADVRQRTAEFAQFVLLTTQQVAGCNSMHGAQQRMARWLLTAQDRAQTDTFRFTHDLLAEMLSIRRTTVSAALQALHAQHLVDSRLGTLTIRDRDGLKLAACPCYAVQERLNAQLYAASLRHLQNQPR